MITQGFAIYDSKSGVYSPPFFQITKGLAIRAFSDTAADQNNMIAKHPVDFTLFYLGDYDDNTGLFTSAPTPTAIMKASETVGQGLSEGIKIPATQKDTN